MKNVLIEGRPGIGKTTLLCRLAERFSHVKIGGFFTEEIREEGRRVGFRIETFSGQSGILAHISFQKGPQVGKYRVDVSQFESIGVASLENALENVDLILMDEIGKMELFSKRFQELILTCLDSDKPVIATVMSRSHPFVDRIKSCSDVRIIEVTLENRDRLVEQLIDRMNHFSST
ncbi:NTPase [bacterium]|nr:NTPase [bacterium]RQV95976.1 MAG: NTPase [bacterium]